MTSFVTLLLAVAVIGCAAAIHIPPHVRATLNHADEHHMRYYPDFQYEGFEAPHMPQPKENLHRRGTGAHDVQDIRATRNPHMANKSTPYPQNLLWLLNMFESGFGLPRSYNDILPNGDVYWATQTYLSIGAFNEFGAPTELGSMIGIQERTLTRFGLNLYDAATWMIALSLWDLHDIAYIYEENILYTSTTGDGGRSNGAPGGIISIRADNADFQYGPNRVLGSNLEKITYPGNVTHFDNVNGKPSKTPTKTGPGSFYYRMIGPHYQMNDPLLGNYGNSWKFPWPNYDSTTTWNVFGEIHFNDWKPITGENVWSSILGPLQALGLRTNNNLTNTTCGNEFLAVPVQCDWQSFDTTPPSVQLSISIIPALLALQDASGTLFHCPWGSKIFPPDPDEGQNLSNENNFSSYASIDVFYWVLTNYSTNTPSQELQWALTAVTRLRTGLQKWFDNPMILSAKGQLPNEAVVVPQGGHLNSSGYFPVPIDTTGGLAVDCQTWGMTVMGRERVDGNWGNGTCYNIWQTTKRYAGYYKGSVLAGVGYTDLANTNGSSIPVNTIWSAEWTFGAINMCQVIGQSYIDNGDVAMGQSMLTDAQQMYSQVSQLWPEGLRFPDGSYVYANKRFFIPWGWFSNPIAATCSTAWSVMQARNFDPFHWGGGNKPQLIQPPELYEAGIW